jgi:hypothetical protein
VAQKAYPSLILNVPSKHKEAHAFLKKGFFDGLKTFQDFETRTE